MERTNLMTRLLLLTPTLLLLSGCNSTGPDFGPVGSGLKIIGIGIVLAALIQAAVASNREDD